MQICAERMDGSGITPSLGKSDDLQDANTGIKRDGEHITDLDPVARRFLSRAVDPDMSLRDQSRSV